MKRFLLTATIIGSLLSPQVSLAETCPAPAPTGTALDLDLHALYPNPNPGEKEWIELSNPNSQSADLSAYTLEDATHHPMTLSGTITAHGIFRVENLSFQLNNGTETVQLKDTAGNLLDEWGYDHSTAGETLTRSTSPAPTPSSTPTPTPTPTPTVTSTPAQWPELSELMANPEGSDSDNEWIELYNPHGETLNLNGLSLNDEDGGSHSFALTGEIPAESYEVFYSDETHITLNNSTDHVRLLGAQSEILWDHSYDSVTEGKSHIFQGESLVQTGQPTPGEENEFAQETENETSNENSTVLDPTQNGDLSEDIELTEVLPNPEGSDAEGEWIELTNGGDEIVNLGNWIIDDGAGGSKPFIIPPGTTIKPGETLVFPRSVSKISLGNTEETLNLIDWNGETQDEVRYENAVENESYAKIQTKEMSGLQASTPGLGPKATTTWQWLTPSPGLINPNAWLIHGEVKSYENGTLTLTKNSQEWTVQMAPSSEDVLLYQIGNQIEVQAIESSGLYTGISAELISSAPQAEESNAPKIPWFGLLFATGGLGYLFNEWRKNKVKMGLSPVLKFN